MIQYRKDNHSKIRPIKRSIKEEKNDKKNESKKNESKKNESKKNESKKNESIEGDIVIEYNGKKVSWFWRSDNPDPEKEWVSYPKATAKKLEIAYNQTGDCEDDIYITGTRYVNIPTMKQRVKGCPDIERDVKREVL